MPSKEDYERVFNQILGTDIKWSKLSREELAQLAVLFSNPKVMAEKLGLYNDIDSARESILMSLRTIARNWEGPLMRIARRIKRDKENKEE